MHPDLLPTGNPTVGRKPTWIKNPPEQKLGVGIVGLHEGHTMLVALRASELCRPVIGCDLSEEKRAQAEQASPGLITTDNYETLLKNPDVDIVCIYTPDSLHADQIIQAFQAGKHVVCTKPLINDPTRIPELLKAAKESGKRLQVGQSTRFYHPFLRMRELYDQGVLGECEAIDTHYNHRMDWYYTKSPWTVDTTHWAYLGLSHPVDLVRWYLGDIKEVHAYGTTTHLGQSHGMTNPDCLSVHMVSDAGRLGRAFGNYGFHELPRGRSLIEGFLMGSQGTALARYPDLRFTYTGPEGQEVEEDYHHEYSGYYYRHELKGMHYGEFCNIIDSFAAAILQDLPNSPDLEEGLQTVLVMGAIVESLETQKPVQVPKLPV